ncbi:hypothetical protein HanPI659440_Chr05g0215001 [Helianthus annuus]|nr:hypothetical protein HanPI659440_Chr05g0215001 [Helianthus annuus]
MTLKQLSIQPEESEYGECCRGAKKVGVPLDKKKIKGTGFVLEKKEHVSLKLL